MTRLLLFAAALVGLLAFSDNAAFGQKKAPNKKAEPDASPATAEQYKLLAKYKEMVGTIQSARTTTAGTVVTLRVEYDRPDPNPAPNLAKNNLRPANNNQRPNNQQGQQAQQIQQKIQQLQRERAAAQNIKNPQQRQQKLQQIAREQQQLQQQIYRFQVQQTQKDQGQMMAGMKGQAPKTGLIKEYLDFELPLVEKVVVRKLSTGVEYDDKGNLVEPEKGTADLPGVAGKVEDVAGGMKAKVYLLPPKGGAAPAKKDGDEALGESLPTNRPQVRMVVLLSEPSILLGGGGKNDRKKPK